MKKVILFIVLFIKVFAVENSTDTGVGTSAADYREQLRNGTIDEYCFKYGESDYLPISDETGKSVFTKREKNLICEKIKKKQGACLEWEKKETEYGLDIKDYDIYKTDDFESDMGSVLGTVSAMGKLKDILGGWKGYCESGMWTDFSWASDPLFWGGMALSYAVGTSDEAADGATEATSKVKEASQALDQAKESGEGVAEAEETLKAAQTARTAEIAKKVNDTYKNFGSAINFINANKCFVSAGLDASRGIRSYLSDGEDGEACDPVDEICEDEAQRDDSYDPITLDESEYEYLVENLEDQDLDPNQIITIIDETDGIYTVVLTNPVTVDPNADSATLDSMRKKFKKVELAISGATTAAKFAGCYFGDVGGNGGADSGGSKGKIGMESVAKMGLNMLAGKVPPPYGQMLQIALKLADSFTFGNTCTDLDFANEMTEQGARPVQASQAKVLKSTGLSHFIYQKCVFKLYGSCKRTRYIYCNYENFLSKILVEQFKLQLGKDWMHCADISLDELKHINFQKCPDGIKNSRANPRWTPGLNNSNQEVIFFNDGSPSSTQPNLNNSSPTNTVSSVNNLTGVFQPPTGMGVAENPFDNPTVTKQYQNKCIDYTEFIEKLKAQMGDEFDETQINDMFKDLGADAPNVTNQDLGIN